jgi:hypothetical protein
VERPTTPPLLEPQTQPGLRLIGKLSLSFGVAKWLQ